MNSSVPFKNDAVNRKLSNILAQFQNNNANAKHYLLNKRAVKNTPYSSYSIVMADNKDANSIATDSIEVLIRSIEQNPCISPYAFKGDPKKDSSIGVILADRMKQHELIFSCFNESSKDGKKCTIYKKESNLKHVRFFVSKVHYKQSTGDTGTLCLFSQWSPSKSVLKRKSIALGMGSTKFQLLDNDASKQIITPEDVDALYMDGYYFIVNAGKFNSVFDYDEYYLEEINKNKDAFISSNIMVNAEEFFDKCCTNKGLSRQRRQLAQSLNDHTLLDYVSQCPNLRNIIKDYSQFIEVNDHNQIVFNASLDDKLVNKQIDAILKLFRHRYVVDPLNSNKMIASGIDNFNISAS